MTNECLNMSLTTEQLSAIEEYAYNLVPIPVMAVMLEVEPLGLREAIADTASAAHRAYYKGYGRMLLETRQSIIRSAHNGSNPAQMALLQFLREFESDHPNIML